MEYKILKYINQYNVSEYYITVIEDNVLFLQNRIFLHLEDLMFGFCKEELVCSLSESSKTLIRDAEVIHSFDSITDIFNLYEMFPEEFL